jgi:hypothetical protein
MTDKEEQIQDELSRTYLDITKGGSMFDNIDTFVALSRRNTSVKEVELFPFDIDVGNYDFWDKVGEILGNFMELQTINFHFLPDGLDEAHRPDWEILTRILQHLRRKVALYSSSMDCDAETEESKI